GDLTQRELGDALHLSFNTVKAYNRQIYRKLGVSSRDQAVAAARAVGLL
ncbi:MAG: response regulator transcription factor, partial [Acidimicrobiales bacterium]|nr:response regulator transcription factor [Acidimicrobiales bacterium]